MTTAEKPANMNEERTNKTMKVSELPYRRVTLEEVKAVMEDVIPRIKTPKAWRRSSRPGRTI